MLLKLGLIPWLREQVLCGHRVSIDHWLAHPDKVKIELISYVFLFDNPLLLNVDIFADHKWRLILGGSLL